MDEAVVDFMKGAIDKLSEYVSPKTLIDLFFRFVGAAFGGYMGTRWRERRRTKKPQGSGQLPADNSLNKAGNINVRSIRGPGKRNDQRS